MKTTPEQYQDYLTKIANSIGADPTIRVPADEHIYTVDLNKRVVESISTGPNAVVTICGDNLAETLYFVVDRYFDNVDLSTTTCVVQYINAQNKGSIYAVPFYDIQTQPGKMIFPWCLSNTLAAAPGTIQFAIKFYKVVNGVKIFDLNTIPQSYKIAMGLDVTEEVTEASPSATVLEEFVRRMSQTDQNIVQFDAKLLENFNTLSTKIDNKNLEWKDL